MSSNSSSSLIQIAFNLFVLIVILIAMVAVVTDLFSPRPNVEKDLVLLVVLGALLFLGVGLLVRLVRSSLGR